MSEQPTTQQEQVPNVIITTRRLQAQFFTENLGNGVGLEMVLISSGSFLMGATEGEEGSSDRERPQHTVMIKSFCMGKYPVTQAQWEAVTSLPQVNRELNPKPSRFEGDSRPVEQISWYDAVEFCERLSQKAKRPYRLPSEAEWEYACRAGTTTPYHFGQIMTPKLANYGRDRGETTPVGSFSVANAFGLFDMHGNVWEWCEDDWHESYEGAFLDRRAWLSDGKNTKKNTIKILRGGSWNYYPSDCRSASRYYFNSVFKYYDFGLRVVCGSLKT
jgi:formylglycine-generating enzyme required for sulfatase activity